MIAKEVNTMEDKNNQEKPLTDELEDKDSKEKKSKRDKKTKPKKSRMQRWKESYREWNEFRKNEIKNLTRAESIWKTLAKFTLPFGMALVFSILLYTIYPQLIGDFGKLFVFYFFNPAGMEVGVIYGTQATELTDYQVVGFMLVIDTLTAIFLIWNFNYSRLLPVFGWLVWVVQASAQKKIEKSKTFRRGRFVGLIIFVMIPAYGTGAILGGIVGKLLAMDPWRHLGAIFIGSALRLTVMAIVTSFIFDYFRSIGWI